MKQTKIFGRRIGDTKNTISESRKLDRKSLVAVGTGKFRPLVDPRHLTEKERIRIYIDATGQKRLDKRNPIKSEEKFGSENASPISNICLDLLPDNHFLTTLQVAVILHRAKRTLDNWRSEGKGPKSVKFENGKVLYRVKDVRAYISSSRLNGSFNNKKD